MAANGISTLTTNGVADKEKRQKAKLEKASAKPPPSPAVEPMEHVLFNLTHVDTIIGHLFHVY